MRTRLLNLIATMVCVLTVPASASHGGIHPTFRQSQVFFRCAGDPPAKVHNFEPAPWGTSFPSGSIGNGDGCVTVDPGIDGATPDAPGNAAFRGAAVGNLTNVTVELWLVGQSVYSGMLGRIDLAVTLLVDGTAYLARNTDVSAVPVQQSETLTKVEFTIENLGFAEEVRDERGEVIDVRTGGLVTEDGDGTTSRTVELRVRLNNAEELGLWAFGASEVPAGLVFNDATPATRVVAATIPGTS